jgi:hypothetical protein
LWAGGAYGQTVSPNNWSVFFMRRKFEVQAFAPSSDRTNAFLLPAAQYLRNRFYVGRSFHKTTRLANTQPSPPILTASQGHHLSRYYFFLVNQISLNLRFLRFPQKSRTTMASPRDPDALPPPPPIRDAKFPPITDSYYLTPYCMRQRDGSVRMITAEVLRATHAARHSFAKRQGWPPTPLQEGALFPIRNPALDLDEMVTRRRPSLYIPASGPDGGAVESDILEWHFPGIRPPSPAGISSTGVLLA